MSKKPRKTKTAPSSVSRVNKNVNYTVMSNYHLRSTNLSLTSICKEKETAIKAALDELKEWGYLTITKLMPNQTASGRIEYVYDFYEYSEKDKVLLPFTDKFPTDTQMYRLMTTKVGDV